MDGYIHVILIIIAQKHKKKHDIFPDSKQHQELNTVSLSFHT